MIGSAPEPEKKSDLFSSISSFKKSCFTVTIKKENGFVEHVNNVMQSRFLLRELEPLYNGSNSPIRITGLV
ncbi:MAG: hypothetical protein C0403_04980 [Desulfobacterium sp.]|nr:hypothetical protein [Desulfobacterium sp.]